MGGGIIGGAIDKVRLTLGRRGRKFIQQQADDTSIFPSAREAQELATATGAKPGSPEAQFKGTDVTIRNREGEQVRLGGLTVIDITDTPIVQRLGALASQTSVVIPKKVREAAQSATDYLTALKDNFGGGDFAKFRDDLDELQNFHSRNRDNSPAYRAIGSSLQEVDKLFRILRFKESEVLYNRVFDKIGNKSYDLSSIDDVIAKTTRPVIPDKPDLKSPVGATQMAFQRGEMGIYDTIDLLKGIGTSKDGLLVSGQGVRNAVKAFNKANPGYEIAMDETLANSPAKLLQLFATRFGEMGQDLSRIPSDQITRAQKNAITTAKTMRSALLDLIGNPKNVDDATKAAIAKDLKDANEFYSETFDIVEAAQTQAKGLTTPYSTEPGQLARDILSGGVAQENLLDAVAKQEQYVIQNLRKVGQYKNPKAMSELKTAFDELLNINMARTLPGRPGEPSSPTAVRDFIDNFSDDEQIALGLTKERRQQILAEAEQLAQLGSGDFIKVVGREAELNSPFLVRFKNAFEGGDLNDNLGKLLTVVNAQTAGTAGKESMENLQKGFWDYLVSTQSGVLKPITRNTPYQRAGTVDNPNFTVDTNKLNEILTAAVETAPNLKKILTPEQMDILKGLQVYTATINRAGPDAGAALAGAQIIGELFTVDPRKFIDGLARLASQQRISQILTNKRVVDAAVGLGAKDKGGLKDTIKTYFTGYGALGALIANLAVNPGDVESQTNRMLGQPRDSQLLQNLNIN